MIIWSSSPVVMHPWKINLLLLLKIFYSTYFMGPTCESQLKSKSCDFKGLVICITGLNCFNLGFYLASYGQFCFRGKTRISAILCFIVSLSLLYFVLLFLVLLFMGTVHTSLEHHIFLPYNSKSSSSSFLSNPKSTTTTQTNSPVCLTSCWT